MMFSLFQAAGAVRPLVSTVIKPDVDGHLKETLIRSQYKNSEMPQAFQYDVIKAAYRRVRKAVQSNCYFILRCEEKSLRNSSVDKCRKIKSEFCVWKDRYKQC